MSIEFLYCLKRERDISINLMFSDGRATFRLSPALMGKTFNFVVTFFTQVYKRVPAKIDAVNNPVI